VSRCAGVWLPVGLGDGNAATNWVVGESDNRDLGQQSVPRERQQILGENWVMNSAEWRRALPHQRDHQSIHGFNYNRLVEQLT